MRVVAALPASALIAGAALGLFLPDRDFLSSAIALGLAWALTLAAWRRCRPIFFTGCVAAIFFVGGMLLGAKAWARAWRPPLLAVFEQVADHGEAFLVVEGTLRADAEPSSSGVSMAVNVDALASCPSRSSCLSRFSDSSGVILTVVGTIARDRVDQWRAGRRIRTPATLRRPSVYFDPGVPDNERALARRGTRLVGTVKSGALVDVLARGSPIDETLAATRAFARRAIVDAVGRWSAPAAAIVTAIVIGDRAGLDPDVQRKLQDAGTYHVIAISGGNIAILAGLLIGGFRVAGWFGRAAMLTSILLLAGYAALVGGGASVERATLMAAIYFAGRAIDHRTAPLNTLAVVAALIVAADPLSVADPAFVLTFGATLAILATVPGIAASDLHETHKNRKHTTADLCQTRFVNVVCSWLSRVIESSKSALLPLFAASLAAEVILFPVGALVFSRITFAGLALNFLAIPLMAVAQIAGMALVPTALASPSLAAIVGSVAAIGAQGLVWSADLVLFAPAVAYRIAAPSPFAVAAYYSAGAAAWWLQSPDRARIFSHATRRFLRVSATFVAAVAALWILIDPRSLLAARGDGRLHVTFVDVGQGDSAFIRFPRGSTLLVDAGGLSFSSTFDIGDRVVAPVVRSAGFYRLDYVALTHGDPDHVGGAPSIVREFRPREVWEGIPVPRSAALTLLRGMTLQRRAKWANVYAGDRLQVDEVDIIARHPRPADWERQKVRNDDSLVLELRWRDVSVLLTGDIGKAVESAVATSLAPSPLRVVKVPHHGSLTSSSEALLRDLHPSVAVFSVGRGNHFGHPAPEVVERYRAVGAEIFRTDQDGAVTVDTDGRRLTVQTVASGRLVVHETHESTKGTK